MGQSFTIYRETLVTEYSKKHDKITQKAWPNSLNGIAKSFEKHFYITKTQS